VNSVRTRITTAVVGTTALVVAVAALIAVAKARGIVIGNLDDRLKARANWYHHVPRTPMPQTPPFNFFGTGSSTNGGSPPPPADAQAAAAEYLFEIRDAKTGEEIFRGSGLPKEQSLADVAQVDAPARTVELLGRNYRMLSIARDATVWGFPPRRRDSTTGGDGHADHDAREKRAIVVHVALDETETDAETQRLAWTLGAVWLGATALSWVVAMAIGRAVLQPVARVRQKIASLSPNNLSARVPLGEAPTELQDVVARLNELIDRLEKAFHRERSTIANIAHELRNPLSALRATVEFGLYQSLTPPQRRTLESSLALAIRMQSLVNGLLTLTRIEAGQEQLAREEVDLVRVLHDAWATIESGARARNVTATWRTPEQLALVTSPTHVGLIAANLLDNAVSHGAPDATVEVELVTTERGVELRVANTCTHDAPPQSEESSPFQLFFRSDKARTSERHFGLGLTLCDRVVRLLGGEIEAKQVGRAFRVVVRLPRPAADASPSSKPSPKSAAAA
jgi:signal transduction histidine kinase